MIFFGPLQEGLVKHTNDKTWENLLTGLSQMMAGEDPGSHFDQWEEDFPNLDSETKRMLSRMLDLDLAKRTAVSEVWRIIGEGEPRILNNIETLLYFDW